MTHQFDSYSSSITHVLSKPHTHYESVVEELQRHLPQVTLQIHFDSDKRYIANNPTVMACYKLNEYEF